MHSSCPHPKCACLDFPSWHCCVTALRLHSVDILLLQTLLHTQSTHPQSATVNPQFLWSPAASCWDSHLRALCHGLSPFSSCQRTVAGSWSKKAAQEAGKYDLKVNIAGKGDGKSIPEPSTWKLSPDAAYLHYCDNETISVSDFGTDWPRTLPPSHACEAVYGL